MRKTNKGKKKKKCVCVCVCVCETRQNVLGIGTLLSEFDLWSKPLIPAYSLAWKRIPKRYLNFSNVPPKRAKRRTIL